jgi:hypothetical protein
MSLPRPPVDDRVACEATLEIDRTAHRRIDPHLVDLDIRLQRWAWWATAFYKAKGLPLQGSDLATCGAPRDAWPPSVVATDAAVQVLSLRQGCAVFAHYCSRNLLPDKRAQVFVGLVQHLARLKATAAPAVSARAFREDLDRARWVLRVVLAGVRQEGYSAPAAKYNCGAYNRTPSRTVEAHQMVEFKERSTLGRPSQIEVINNSLPVGHISKGADGTYRYYRGMQNETTPQYSDRSLEALKAKVRQGP